MIVLFGTALFLRAYQLGERDFWFDESCTFYYLQNLFDWPDDSRLLVESTNLPYYVLLRWWMAIFGEREAALRSMSVIASLAAILFLGLAARRLAGRQSALVTMALASVHPLSIYYAREARAYALWMLLLAVLLWLLAQACITLKKSWWVAYGAALLFTLHLHYFTVYWVAASPAFVWIAANRGRAVRQWLITHVITAGLFVPYFFMAVWPAARAGGSAWIGEGGPAWSMLARTLWAFLPAGVYPAHLRGLSLASGDTHSPWPTWMDQGAAVVPVLVTMLATWLFWRGQRQGQEMTDAAAGRRRSVYVACGGGVMVALLLPIFYSLVVRPTYLVARYDLVAWPAFMVGLGALLVDGWRRFSPRTVGRPVLIVVALLCLCSVVADARMLNPPPGASPNQMRAQRLAKLTGPNDLVVALSYDRWALHYELHRAGFEGRLWSFPSWIDRQVGWVDTKADLAALADGRVAQDADRLVEEVSATLRDGGHVWLLADSLDVKNVGARAMIHQEFIAAMTEAGMSAETRVEEFAIFEIGGR